MWRQVYNAEKEYLDNRKDYIIVITKFSTITSEILKMEHWCKNNIVNCWSVGKFVEYDNKITFRFWNKNTSDYFKKTFKDYIISSL